MVFDFEKAKTNRENDKKKREQKRREVRPLFPTIGTEETKPEIPPAENATEKVFDTGSRSFKAWLILKQGESIEIFGIKSDSPRQAIDKAILELSIENRVHVIPNLSRVIDVDTRKEYDYNNEEVV